MADPTRVIIDVEALYPYIIKYLTKQYHRKVTDDEFEEMVYWTVERALRYQHKYDPSRSTVSTWICLIANSAYSRVLVKRPQPLMTPMTHGRTRRSTHHRDAWIAEGVELVGLPAELDGRTSQSSPEDALIAAIDLKRKGIDPFQLKRTPRRSSRKH